MKLRLISISVILVSCFTSTAKSQLKDDSFVRLDTVKICSNDSRIQREYILNNQFGIGVQNLYNHTIYYYPGRRGTWQPLSGFRETIGGRLVHYYIATNHAADQDEYDWNINVLPDAAFGPKIVPPAVECEVTVAPAFRVNQWFPALVKVNYFFSFTPPSVLSGRNICVYGPWVEDTGNGNQREIHPIEAIWWQTVAGNNSDITMLLLQDATRHRFTEISDFFGDDDDPPHAGWKPWVQYPQKEVIRIPFQCDPSTGKYTVINIQETQSLKVVTQLYQDLADSDKGTNHKLKVSATKRSRVSPTLVEVNELPNTTKLGIQFSDICKSPSGIISGYVRVLTAIGYPNTRDPGFQVLKISFTTNQSPHGQPPTQ